MGSDVIGIQDSTSKYEKCIVCFYKYIVFFFLSSLVKKEKKSSKSCRATWLESCYCVRRGNNQID